jgi:tRNA G26 N,N-dimethylase Trm1
MKQWIYVCVSTTCGHVEHTTFAPAASKKCPACGGLMRRENA